MFKVDAILRVHHITDWTRLLSHRLSLHRGGAHDIKARREWWPRPRDGQWEWWRSSHREQWYVGTLVRRNVLRKQWFAPRNNYRERGEGCFFFHLWGWRKCVHRQRLDQGGRWAWNGWSPNDPHPIPSRFCGFLQDRRWKKQRGGLLTDFKKGRFHPQPSFFFKPLSPAACSCMSTGSTSTKPWQLRNNDQSGCEGTLHWLILISSSSVTDIRFSVFLFCFLHCHYYSHLHLYDILFI